MIVCSYRLSVCFSDNGVSHQVDSSTAVDVSNSNAGNLVIS